MYEINPKIAESVSLDEILEDFEFIALELPEGMQMSGIRKMKFHDGSIFTLDMTAGGGEQRIVVFDNDGTFKYAINRPGRGPGEYEFIYDFAFADEYLVICTTTHLLFNDISDGSFSHSIPNRFDDNWVQWIRFFDANYGVSVEARGRGNRSMNHFRFFSIETQSVVQEDVPFPSHAVLLNPTYRHFFDTPDGIKARPASSNIVYAVQRDSEDTFSVHKDYALDFGNLWIPESFLRTSFRNMDQIFREGLHQEYVYSADIFETSHILFVNYIFEQEDFAFLHDRRNGRQVDISGFTDNRIGLSMNPLTTHGDYLAGIIYPFELDEDDELDPQLRAIIEHQSDAGHPMVVLASLRLE